MAELTNDENIKNLKKRKILRILIIIFATITILLALLTIITEFFDLGFKVSVIFALVSYIITAYIRIQRDKIIINKSKELINLENKSKHNKKKQSNKRKK